MAQVQMQKKQGWIDIVDEPEAREVYTETFETTRIKPIIQDGLVLSKIEETVRTTKRFFPVHKRVKQRKLLPKFGEVAGFERGNHRKGDMIPDVSHIQTGEQQVKQEIDIVTKIKGLTTDNLKKKKIMEKMQAGKDVSANQKTEQLQLNKGANEKRGAAKLSEYFEAGGQGMLSRGDEMSILVQNIVLVESQQGAPQSDEYHFKDFIQNEIYRLFEEQGQKVRPKLKVKVIRLFNVNKGMAKAYITFIEQQYSMDALELLKENEIMYNYGLLEFSQAPGQKPLGAGLAANQSQAQQKKFHN